MELILFPLLLVVMWFLLIRPQQARLRAQRDLVSTLEAGDRVVTAGGIIGTITMLSDAELRLETSPGVELSILRAAVSQRLDEPGADLDDEFEDDEDEDDEGDEDEVLDDDDDEEGVGVGDIEVVGDEGDDRRQA